MKGGAGQIIASETAPLPGDAIVRRRNCSVERTLGVVFDTWTFLVLREVYLGARRFEQIQSVLQCPRSTLSDRLTHLCEERILFRRSSGPAGRRGSYRLSGKGLDLYLVMLAMLRFGDEWLHDGREPPLRLVHLICGKPCTPLSVCSACAGEIHVHEVAYRDGPGAGTTLETQVRRQRRRSISDENYERGRPSSVSRTLRIIGDRWTFLILREAFFGIKRFEQLQVRLGIAPNILTDRLQRLVATGVFERRPTRLPDGRCDHRLEYRLTSMGRALYLPLIEMLRWGDRWISQRAPLILAHKVCGLDFLPKIVCSHCRTPLDARDMSYTLAYDLARSGGEEELVRQVGDPA